MRHRRRALEATVPRFNVGAARGRDDEFHRGESAYNRIQGEPEHKPNPCVAPIVTAPFYAVQDRRPAASARSPA